MDLALQFSPGIPTECGCYIKDGYTYLFNIGGELGGFWVKLSSPGLVGPLDAKNGIDRVQSEEVIGVIFTQKNETNTNNFILYEITFIENGKGQNRVWLNSPLENPDYMVSTKTPKCVIFLCPNPIVYSSDQKLVGQDAILHSKHPPTTHYKLGCGFTKLLPDATVSRDDNVVLKITNESNEYPVSNVIYGICYAKEIAGPQHIYWLCYTSPTQFTFRASGSGQIVSNSEIYNDGVGSVEYTINSTVIEIFINDSLISVDTKDKLYFKRLVAQPLLTTVVQIPILTVSGAVLKSDTLLNYKAKHLNTTYTAVNGVLYLPGVTDPTTVTLEL